MSSSAHKYFYFLWTSCKEKECGIQTVLYQSHLGVHMAFWINFGTVATGQVYPTHQPYLGIQVGAVNVCQSYPWDMFGIPI